MKRLKVDLGIREVWIGKKRYWWKDDDYNEKRIWFTKSKKYAYVSDCDDYEEGERVLISEIEAQENKEGPVDWSPADKRVKHVGLIRLLNKVIDDTAKIEDRKEKRRTQEIDEALRANIRETPVVLLINE